MKMRERLLLNPAVAAEKHDRSHEDDAQVERQRGVADLPVVDAAPFRPATAVPSDLEANRA
jgi:hypothetical protein